MPNQRDTTANELERLAQEAERTFLRHPIFIDELSSLPRMPTPPEALRARIDAEVLGNLTRALMPLSQSDAYRRFVEDSHMPTPWTQRAPERDPTRPQSVVGGPAARRSRQESEAQLARIHELHGPGGPRARAHVEVIRKLALELDTMRQALWDVYTLFGYNTDGTDNPDGAPHLRAIVLEAARECRTAYDLACAVPEAPPVITVPTNSRAQATPVFSREGARWSEDEDRRLLALFDSDVDMGSICFEHGRSNTAVSERLRYYGRDTTGRI